MHLKIKLAHPGDKLVTAKPVFIAQCQPAYPAITRITDPAEHLQSGQQTRT